MNWSSVDMSVFAILFLICMCLIKSVVVIRGNERIVIFRLGLFSRISGPGFVIVLWPLEQSIKINLDEKVPNWLSLSYDELTRQLKDVAFNAPHINKIKENERQKQSDLIKQGNFSRQTLKEFKCDDCSYYGVMGLRENRSAANIVALFFFLFLLCGILSFLNTFTGLSRTYQFLAIFFFIACLVSIPFAGMKQRDMYCPQCSTKLKKFKIE